LSAGGRGGGQTTSDRHIERRVALVQRILEIAGSVQRRPFPAPDRELVLRLLGGPVTAA